MNTETNNHSDNDKIPTQISLYAFQLYFNLEFQKNSSVFSRPASAILPKIKTLQIIHFLNLM